MEQIELILILLSEEIEKEADSCNEYAKNPSTPQKDELYQRAGLLYSLSTICKNTAKRAKRLK